MAEPDLTRHLEQQRPFTAGQIIFRQGEPGDHMYIIADGQVDLSVDEQHLVTIGPGGIFGEMALIDNHPRSATAIARDDCILVIIDRAHFLTLIQKTPLFALQVMRVMAERLRRTTQQPRS
jgi:CRP-like cAMP-binding protein